LLEWIENHVFEEIGCAFWAQFAGANLIVKEILNTFAYLSCLSYFSKNPTSPIMKKFAFALLLLVFAGAVHAQNGLNPSEGPIQPGNGQWNQPQYFDAVVTLIANDVHVVDFNGQVFGLNNGNGLLQSNQIHVGEVITVMRANAQDFNTSRSNKERG
jgi:hypothetical protein